MTQSGASSNVQAPRVLRGVFRPLMGALGVLCEDAGAVSFVFRGVWDSLVLSAAGRALPR